MGNFHALEFVDRGSETQIQMGENVNKLTLTRQGLNEIRAIQEHRGLNG